VGETEPCSALTVIIAGANDAFFAGRGLNVRALTDSMINSVNLLVAKGAYSLHIGEWPFG